VKHFDFVLGIIYSNLPKSQTRDVCAKAV